MRPYLCPCAPRFSFLQLKICASLVPAYGGCKNSIDSLAKLIVAPIFENEGILSYLSQVLLKLPRLAEVNGTQVDRSTRMQYSHVPPVLTEKHDLLGCAGLGLGRRRSQAVSK